MSPVLVEQVLHRDSHPEGVLPHQGAPGVHQARRIRRREKPAKKGKDSCEDDVSLSYILCWLFLIELIIHAQYFTLIDLNWKNQLWS